MFRRPYSVSLNRVRDTVIIREGEETLKLTVNGDAMRLVAGLTKAQEKLSTIKEDTPNDEVREAAKYFATVIFGMEQATKLAEFYADDPACIITVCGRYFRERLAGEITKVQRKIEP